MNTADQVAAWQLSRAEAEKLNGHGPLDPFAILGPHDTSTGRIIRAMLPGAKKVEVVARQGSHALAHMEPGATAGLFEVRLQSREPYKLRIFWPDSVQEMADPYSFGLLLGELDLYLFNEGRHFDLGDVFGAQPTAVDGISGVRFAVWAPNGRRVAVIGDFNAWDFRRHPMRARYPSGIWELFIPDIGLDARYKFAIVGPAGEYFEKADPVARRAELPPATASVVAAPAKFDFRDHAWMAGRAARHDPRAPLVIYEAHLESWMRDETGRTNWDLAIKRLIPYAVEMGFTHIELLPIAEYPFGGSWGYQPISLFAPSSRYGSPEDFARFVDAAHRAGIGVILDWVPAHFPTDAHGLARFDGTALYEHVDPREGFHHDWNTYIYNFGRNEVQGFLIASALFWFEKFHVDGLRVDAVASMLYRDYSRAEGEWVPNIHGGRENLEAIGFIKHLNTVIRARCPGAMMIAEESTAWPGVTRPVGEGGLGFDYKWNMGWMHDTLRYMARDPIHRPYHHDDITFGLLYAFSEHYILPLSHDEVVYGKGSLIGKMPGDDWQRFANLRAYLSFMWAHPGKKLLFMGGELGQEREWSHDGEVDWHAVGNERNAGLQRLVRDLNRLYAREGALHQRDSEAAGFRWVIGDDRQNSVFAFLRFGNESAAPILAVCNMAPVPRHAYRIGVPSQGTWREIFNSDAALYGGSNVGNAGETQPRAGAMHGEQQFLEIVLPPLAVLFLRAEV